MIDHHFFKKQWIYNNKPIFAYIRFILTLLFLAVIILDMAMVIPPVIHSSSLSGPEIWISASGSWSTSKAFTKTKPATDRTSWNGTSTEEKWFSCFFSCWTLKTLYFQCFFQDRILDDSAHSASKQHMAETSGKIYGKIQCFFLLHTIFNGGTEDGVNMKAYQVTLPSAEQRRGVLSNPRNKRSYKEWICLAAIHGEEKNCLGCKN